MACLFSSCVISFLGDHIYFRKFHVLLHFGSFRNALSLCSVLSAFSPFSLSTSIFLFCLNCLFPRDASLTPPLTRLGSHSPCIRHLKTLRCVCLSLLTEYYECTDRGFFAACYTIVPIALLRIQQVLNNILGQIV